MQNWRFDDLTRSLGKATSRRGVLKGLLGGLAATLVGRSLHASDAAAAGCDVKKCKDAALRELFVYENTTCNNLCHDRKLWLACLGCKINANRQYQKWLEDCEKGDGCLTVNNSICCGGICVDSTSDPQNCGGCGHVCPTGATCEFAKCSCPDDQTNCNDHCVDTQTDHDHCGSCETHCGACQECQGGQCVAKTCAEGTVCCQGNCVPLCLSGDQPDPTTCQCNICKGQIDGAACDANNASLACCQEHCVDTTCPAGKHYDFDICRCQCTATCPNGQLQDPETCVCQDLCANVSCSECQTCDPTSGDCVQADDQTPCGNGQVCCGGTCCTSNKSCCQGVCKDSSQGCCDDPVQVCYGSNGQPSGECCPAGTGCHAWVDGSGNNSCCPLMGSDGPYPGAPYPALPGGVCCSGTGYQAVLCSGTVSDGTWVCCDYYGGQQCC
jgi:hypothetical protein